MPNSFYIDKSIQIIELSDYSNKTRFIIQLLKITNNQLSISNFFLYTDSPFGFLFKGMSIFSRNKISLITEIRSYVLLNPSYLIMRFGKVKGFFVKFCYKVFLFFSFYSSKYIILINDFPNKYFNNLFGAKFIKSSDCYIEDDFYYRLDKKYDSINEIIYIGNIIYGKRVDWVIEVFNLMYSDNNKMRLRIIGDGPLLEDMIKLVQRLGLSQCVNFTGRITNKEVIRDLLLNSDLLISTSVSETGPRVIAEAASLKLLVFSTRTGSILNGIDDRCKSNSVDFNSFYLELKEFIQLNPLVLSEIAINNYQNSKKYNKNTILNERVQIWNLFAN
jgi:glycosyltransferase involved in cell wall biosynthesis